MLTPTQSWHTNEGGFDEIRESDFWELFKRGLVFYRIVIEAVADAEKGLQSSEESIQERVRDILFPADMLASDDILIDLPRTKARLARLRQLLQSEESQALRREDIVSQAKVMREALEDDLEKVTVFIPETKRASHFSESNESKMFGDAVYEQFPSLRFDIREANNCYATDNYTACVFHLMRIVEGALRLLAKKLRVHLKKRLEYANWIDIQKGINEKLKTVRGMERGPKRDAEYQFYSDAADRCQYFKELWRDDLMHSRIQFDDAKAFQIMARVREFLESLAVRIGDKSGHTKQ